jgi:hypothetical protein
VKITNIFLKVSFFWFASFFTLSASFLKLNLGVISISLAALIPTLSFFFIPKIQKTFLNEGNVDKNFKYTVFAVVIFLCLMFIQTPFADFQERAIAELVKTLLFFVVTHAFYSMMINTKKIDQMIRISLWVSAFFIAYLSYVYFFIFGSIFIGNDLTEPTQTGRNTLSLYIFLCTAMAASISFSRSSKSRSYIDYFLVVFFLITGFLTGSRFFLVFGILFILPIVMKNIFHQKLTASIVIKFLFVLIVILLIISVAASYFEILFLDGYFSAAERLFTIGQNNSDSERIILLRTGIKCFEDGNILIGNGVKDYLTCVLNSPLRTDYILHNDHLSILNNVGLIGFSAWIFSICSYAKVFSLTDKNYIFSFSVLIFLAGLIVIDGYNSPIFGLLLAFSRKDWYDRNSSLEISRNKGSI